MKKIIKGLLFGLAAVSVISCEYNNPNEGKFGGDSQIGYVEFASEGETKIGFPMGSTANLETSIPVILNAPVNEDGLIVTYTVEDIQGSEYYSTSGKITIEEGELQANIPFTVDPSATSCVQFVITLTSVSRSNVSVGFDGQGILTHTVIATPVSSDFLIGSFGAVDVEGGQSFDYDLSISAGEEENEFIISGLYDIDSSTETTVFISDEGVVTFPQWNDNFFATLNVGELGPTDVYIAGYEGTVSCGSVEIVYQLVALVDDEVTALTDVVTTTISLQ